ncbi:MAG: hypothetical protein RR372_03755 [Oscillospiraceae bacterium]
MPVEIVWLIAAISTVSIIVLWFYEVRRNLRLKRSTAKSARLQLKVCRNRLMQARDTTKKAEAQNVFERSLDIYHQSVDSYNQKLKKPQYFVPGYLMGFRKINEDEAL